MLERHSYPLTHKVSIVLVLVAHAEGVAHAACFPLTPRREFFYELRS